MSRRVAECNARTAADLRLHAEKAAFDGQTLRAFFNSLQARTSHKLSPETRLFAELCYEQKLISYVSTALSECAKSDRGREKAVVISRTSETMNLRATWKPLIDHCAQLLRSLKLEATNTRLSRLSELWSQSEEHTEQQRRLKEVVESIAAHSIERASGIYEDIIDWSELNSLPISPERVIYRFVSDQELRESDRSIVVVDRSETFSEAAAFLERAMENESRVHVIVGNEEDSARFYKKIFDQFSIYGLQLNWREKKYGRHPSPKIVIGSLDYFTSYHIDKSKTTISAVVLHAERNMEEPIEISFEKGTLDDYLTELYVLVTITMKHYNEIDELIAGNRSDELTQLMRTWPTGEHQVLKPDFIKSIWDDCFNKCSHSMLKIRFMEYLRAHIDRSLEEQMEHLKFQARFQTLVPKHLRGYENTHRSNFLRSSVLACAAELGQDYVLYSDRSSRYLPLKIRLKKHANNNFGMLQFLELRHGCALTPYRVPKRWMTPADLIKIHHSVVRQHAELPMYSTTSKNHFHIIAAAAAEHLKDFLLIIVCPSIQLLKDVQSSFKMTNYDGVVRVCETTLGVANELDKNASGTLVVCTTTVHFEGWKFLPRKRENLRILVFHQEHDNAAVEVAFDLASRTEIENYSIMKSDDRNKMLGDFQKTENIWLKSQINKVKSVFSDCSSTNPEMLLDKYCGSDEFYDLLQAKRLLHRKLRFLSVTAKIVSSRLPHMKFESADSPLDIASLGFLESSRNSINEATNKLKEVEEKLFNRMKQRIQDVHISEEDLHNIARRNNISTDLLESFVKDNRKRSYSWTELRAKIAQRFDLKEDAENYWARCVDKETRPGRRLIALSSKCVSSATAFLPDLRLATWQENYRQSLLKCSDRPLDDCTMYCAEPGLNEEKLLEMDGASIELISMAPNEFRQPSSGTLPGNVVDESWTRHCPLYLFPQRCYDRLTRDLFDSGIFICSDYESAVKQMHPYDTILLPIISETRSRSPLERLLKMESALLEYGSKEWMEWLARRLKYSDYHDEVVRFYHRTVAEIDYCVQDEQLIQRLREALTDPNRSRATTRIDQMRVDAFVYNAMDILQRGERLVLIEPPFASDEALHQLTQFIRARRMPPPER